MATHAMAALQDTLLGFPWVIVVLVCSSEQHSQWFGSVQKCVQPQPSAISLTAGTGVRDRVLLLQLSAPCCPPLGC